MSLKGSVLVVGAGAIGTGFAAVFRAAGHNVLLCDPSDAARDAAPAAMVRAGLPSGDPGELHLCDKPPETATPDLMIEAGPERVEVKAALFADLLMRLPKDTILATASSAIPMSQIVPNPADQARCLVAHPANPPSLIRVIELVPAPGTLPDVTQRAARIFRDAGFAPVTLNNEMPAFVFNRLQSALLREAYRLIDEGVIGVDGIDTLVRDGLGPRWALSGPFETADLNTAGGIKAHAARMGPAYAAIGAARGETHPDWSDALVDRVHAERRALCPDADLPARRAWREKALADLLAARALILNDGDAP